MSTRAGLGPWVRVAGGSALLYGVLVACVQARADAGTFVDDPGAAVSEELESLRLPAPPTVDEDAVVAPEAPRPTAVGSEDIAGAILFSGGPPTTARLEPPVSNIGAGGPLVTGGTVPNATAVVARLGPKFRRCYAAAGGEALGLVGSARITVGIGPEGDVTSVGITSTANVPPQILPCLTSAVRGAQFAPTLEGTPGGLVIPVQLRPRSAR